uniref:Uncharacterized protein n=2 Tax=Kalmanozyma brasiliensis (strain GHG001) TaxID=1365824 RepID=V5F3B5_KALBG
MLGEEMLLANKTLNVESQSIGTSSHARRKQPRAQSMAFGIDSYSNPASSPTLPSSGSKTRALSQKLLLSRSQRVKSLDRAFPDMMQAPTSAPASLSRTAAAILGLPHPDSSGASARKSAEEVLATDEELDTLSELQSNHLIPSGLEEFNEPTPHVAQLAAFSAAALDEADSPTLPHDGPFRASDRSTALAESESRKLAAVREERRRRVAKMSRWLGEAVPAELIHSGADHAVIRSTSASQGMSIEHSHDSTAYAASLRSSSSCNGKSEAERKLQSFMSIDSSDEEGDDTPVRVGRKHRGLAARSPASIAASYEYDRARLCELASMLDGTRDTILTTIRPARASATSPSMTSDLSPSLAHASSGPAGAFLDLSGSESDSSTAEDEPREIDVYPTTLRRPHDRSLSKLSSFFGSTPQQIVREQAGMTAAEGLGVTLGSLHEESWETGVRGKVGGRRVGV